MAIDRLLLGAGALQPVPGRHSRHLSCRQAGQQGYLRSPSFTVLGWGDRGCGPLQLILRGGRGKSGCEKRRQKPGVEPNTGVRGCCPRSRIPAFSCPLRWEEKTKPANGEGSLGQDPAWHWDPQRAAPPEAELEHPPARGHRAPRPPRLIPGGRIFGTL